MRINARRRGVILVGLAALELVAIAGCRPAPSSSAMTYYVIPAGSDSSACLEAEPCSLSRAVALVNNGTIGDCSTVRVAPGYYSQAALTITGSGRADCRISFIGAGDAILTGTRLQLPPEAWTLTPGRQYTYQAKHADELFNSSNPAQRNPSNWQPITVANNATSTLVVELDFPPRYSNVDTVDKVEAQSCTHHDDPAADLVYVHMCNDRAPSLESDFWLSSTGWGTLTIQGGYITIAGINLQHSGKSGSNGFTIDNSAVLTILRDFDFRATGITAQGIDSVLEDGRVGYVILQGPAGGSQCFDRNPDVGVGECWNAQGTGSAVDIGIEASAKSYGSIMRRVYVHRSWNGFSLRGPNTAEDNVFQGFPNHTVGFNGTGGVFRRNVMLNGQDSLYSEGNDFDELVVEHNVAHNGVLFWVSRDGKGGTPPTRWVFRNNILSTIVFEDKTFPSAVTDCNVYLESMVDPGADMFRITGSDGGESHSYNTLADWQKGTGRDLRSLELASPNWTNGAQFQLFTLQTEPFDFHLTPSSSARRVCGTYAGPYGHGR